MSAAACVTWEHTDSSNVNRVAYHDETRTLCVEFNNGGLYTYSDVEPDHYHGLVGAISVGQYMNDVIKVLYPYNRFYNEVDLLASLL